MNPKSLKNFYYFVLTFVTLLTFCSPIPQISLSDSVQEFDWRSDWEVRTGFSLTVDTLGYNFPTSIAFVPNPGTNPNSPLYFVTELQGTLKVVTNDRNVITYAKDFIPLSTDTDVRTVQDQFGMAGLCLAPEFGYLFITYAYRDNDGNIRNGVIRFEDSPDTFSVQPSGHRDIVTFLGEYAIASNHQIGKCRVQDEWLYIGIGDGTYPEVSQQLDSPLGKVLRFDLNGKPSPENPFYESNAHIPAKNSVWAYGFRNPFGVEVIGERVFVVENGVETDRFLEVKQGENYLWDGSGWSIGARSRFVFSPAVAPTDLALYPYAMNYFPQEYENTFFVGLSGLVSQLSEGPYGPIEGIMTIPYDFELGEIAAVPEYFVHYIGSEIQSIVGLTFGDDGLYFAPLLPNLKGESAIYRISYDPQNEHPHILGQNETAQELITRKGCLGCHQLDGRGGQVGPSLDRDVLVQRLNERLNSADYLISLDSVDLIAEEPFISFTEERDTLRYLSNSMRIKQWMEYRLLEPRFDDPYAQMPKLELTQGEAKKIADFLLDQPNLSIRIKDVLRRLLPPSVSWWHLFYALLTGVGVALIGLLILRATGFVDLRFRRRTKRSGG